MLGEDKESRIALLSDRAEATFRVIFADEAKPALEILMADFIDEKSAKAKGKRISTLDIASFEDITPEPEPEPEVSPDEIIEEATATAETGETQEEEGEETEIDIDGIPMTIGKPKDTQLDLF